MSKDPPKKPEGPRQCWAAEFLERVDGLEQLRRDAIDEEAAARGEKKAADNRGAKSWGPLNARVGQGTFIGLIRGRFTVPGADTIQPVADFYGATYNYLLDGSMPMFRPVGPRSVLHEVPGFQRAMEAARKKHKHIPLQIWNDISYTDSVPAAASVSVLELLKGANEEMLKHESEDASPEPKIKG